MKKLLSILLLIALCLSFVACGDEEEQPTKAIEKETTPTVTVTYANTTMNDSVVVEGATLSQPADPEKEDNIFGGWYLDSAYKTEATFPLTVNADTTLFAKFETFADAFTAAREKTIGDDVTGFEYDYDLNVSVSYGAVSTSGKTEGNTKYSTTGDVSFYDKHVNSGLLFYDGTEYAILRGNSLQTISLNEDGYMRKYNVTEVGDDYKFDTSSFAKALFEYTADQLKTIGKTATKNEYELNTSFNFSDAISLVNSCINSSIVNSLISGLPESNVDTGMYVTFSNGEISTYRYEMHINVAAIRLDLVYNLTFKNVGVAQTIVPDTFEDLSLTSSEITTSRKGIEDFITLFKGLSSSSYDFTVKTGVGFDGKNEINATFDGSSIRKTIAGVTYFHNTVEIDSDYKNADLYKSTGLADQKIKKTKLADGSVWLIEKKLLQDVTTKLTDYVDSDSDNYFLGAIYKQLQNLTYIQKVENTESNEIIYSVGIGSLDTATLLTWLNENLDLDPLNKSSVDVKVFGDFENVTMESAEILVTVRDGALYSVTLKVEGNYSTKFANSRDFTELQPATFSVSYTLTVTDDGDSYTPYDTVNKAK